MHAQNDLNRISEFVSASADGWVEINFDRQQLPVKPVVSVCVQTYQHARFIATCLDSIVSQETNFEFEVLVGEDRSRDGTRDVCMEYARKYPHLIRLFLHDRSNQITINGTVTGRFNLYHNFTSSQGRYIAICEGDDFWVDRQKLQKQVEFLDNHQEFMFSFHNAIPVDAEDRPIGSPVLGEGFHSDYSQEQILSGARLPTASVCFRRDLIALLPDSYFLALNGDSYLNRFGAQFGKAGYVDVQPSGYRLHAGGIWSGKDQEFRMKNNLNTLRKLLPELQREYQPVVAKRICALATSLAVRQLRSLKPLQAMESALKNLVYSIRHFGPRFFVYQCQAVRELIRSRKNSPSDMPGQ